jgi:hypothetical protein
MEVKDLEIGYYLCIKNYIFSGFTVFKKDFLYKIDPILSSFDRVIISSNYGKIPLNKKTELEKYFDLNSMILERDYNLSYYLDEQPYEIDGRDIDKEGFSKELYDKSEKERKKVLESILTNLEESEEYYKKHKQRKIDEYQGKSD